MDGFIKWGHISVNYFPSNDLLELLQLLWLCFEIFYFILVKYSKSFQRLFSDFPQNLCGQLEIDAVLGILEIAKLGDKGDGITAEIITSSSSTFKWYYFEKKVWGLIQMNSKSSIRCAVFSLQLNWFILFINFIFILDICNLEKYN